MDRLKGKVSIVTGSANGIGEATAKLMAREGAQLAIVDVDDENGQRVANEIETAGGSAGFWHLDVSQAVEVEKVFASIHKRFGQINILVNNAGIAGGRGAPHKVAESELDRVMAVNVKGPFFCNKYAVPFMIKAGGGSIVNVASCYGIIGCDTPAYDASKGALRSMTKSDAICLRKHNIRVNSVHPGNIWTPLFEKLVVKLGGGLENTERLISGPVPLGRMGKPDEVAYGILFLASDEASYITAAELLIDGGMVFAPLPIYPPEVPEAPGISSG
ncbi:MAG TPA: glucose 1-dehydrogenase [Dehalococcoidales bacterium]|nr:glucose 1-dehydrogenase [Dehalococcoidales bacterium]